MENQDIAANYRDENSQLVTISPSLPFLEGGFPYLVWVLIISFVGSSHT